MAVVDNPVLMAVPFINMGLNAFGGRKLSMSDEALTDMLAPTARWLLQDMSGRDIMTGERIKIADFQNLPEFGASSTGQLVRSLYDAPSQAWTNLVNLAVASRGPAAAIPYEARRQLGRDFMGADRVLFPMIGGKGVSIGGMLDASTGGFPGVWQYSAKPYQNAQRRQKSALDALIYNRRQLEQSAPDWAYKGATEYFESAAEDENP
jgi:hypothetical protein